MPSQVPGRQSSKSGASKAPSASAVPTMPGPSSYGASRAPATRAPTMTDSSRLPTAMHSQAPPSYATAAPSASKGAATELKRDGPSTFSYSPSRGAATTLQRDGFDPRFQTRPPKDYQQDDSRVASVPQSRGPSTVPTTLSRGPTTSFQRDGPTRAPPTARGGTSLTMIPSSRVPSRAPTNLTSIHRGSTAINMASRQVDFDTMSIIDQAKQSTWAQSVIQKQKACPEGLEWVRRDGGYQCTGGGHGLSDILIAEGKCGVMSLPTKTWLESDGIYYPAFDGAPGDRYHRAIGSEADIHLHAPGAKVIPKKSK